MKNLLFSTFVKNSFYLKATYTFLFISIIFGQSQIWAQCTDGNSIQANTVGTNQFGQSFTADCDGNLSNFTYTTINGNGFSMSMTVREGEGCGGNILGTENYTQVAGVNSIDFSSPIALTDGQLYSVIIQGNHTALALNASSPYLDGALLFQSNCTVFPQNQWDMVFSYTIEAAVVADPQVPTLSEWGLIILALLLMTFGTLQLIRKESKETT